MCAGAAPAAEVEAVPSEGRADMGGSLQLPAPTAADEGADGPGAPASRADAPPLRFEPARLQRRGASLREPPALRDPRRGPV